MEVIEKKKALQFVKIGLGKSKTLKSNAGIFQQQSAKRMATA